MLAKRWYFDVVDANTVEVVLIVEVIYAMTQTLVLFVELFWGFLFKHVWNMMDYNGIDGQGSWKVSVEFVSQGLLHGGRWLAAGVGARGRSEGELDLGLRWDLGQGNEGIDGFCLDDAGRCLELPIWNVYLPQLLLFLSFGDSWHLEFLSDYRLDRSVPDNQRTLLLFILLFLQILPLQLLLPLFILFPLLFSFFFPLTLFLLFLKLLLLGRFLHLHPISLLKMRHRGSLILHLQLAKRTDQFCIEIDVHLPKTRIADDVRVITNDNRFDIVLVVDIADRATELVFEGNIH